MPHQPMTIPAGFLASWWTFFCRGIQNIDKNTIILLVTLCFPLISLAETSGLRESIALDGTWQGAMVPYGTGLDQVTNWADQSVPGVFHITLRHPHRQAWVRRSIEIPEGWAGRRIFVRLGGALYHPHVYIDGRLVGQRLDGWHPLEVEVTSAVTPGSTHELAVLTLDQTAVYAEGVPRGMAYTNQSRRGKVLAPIGGYKDFVGVWDSATLYATPRSHFVREDLVISPSTRKMQLQLSGRIDTTEKLNGLTVTALVYDADNVVLESDKAKIDEQGGWALTALFPGARFWSPEDPHRYTLHLRLHDPSGRLIDQLEQRFGFKEFWAEGPDLYLNGVKRHLLADSEWPPSRPQSREKIRSMLETFKSEHVVAFRTHLGGWQHHWFDLADELGMMMIPETAVYTDGEGFYAYDDDRFWSNFRDHIEHMLKTYRNRPSVVMYSLGNEILFMGNADRATDLPRKLGDMARFAKTIDPYHLYTFEADIDPDGAYDVIGLHYPHEVPANFAYPNTGDWLAERKQTEAGGGMLGQTRSDFYWERKKPLYIGEYLWAPFEDYSVGSVYFGDRAYQHRYAYWMRAKFMAHRDQTLAYRRANVSGLCPWGTFKDPQDYYKHVAVFLYSRDQRAYPDQTFDFAYDVFNDGPTPLDMTLRITEADGRVKPVEEKVALAPGGYQRVTLRIDTPAAPGTLSFMTKLLTDEKVLHEVKHGLEVWGQSGLAVPDGIELIVFDPSGAWPNGIDSLGSLSSVGRPDKTVLLIAPGALGGSQANDVTMIGAQRFDTAAFLNFVNRGGRAVVLEQSTLAPLGLGLDLIEHAATMTFAIDPNHPLLKGLDAQSLKHWRGDHYVSRYEIVRPGHGGGRGVVVSGGERSLRQGPVVEMPAGEGYVVLLQALVGQKRGDEPAAGRLLQNAINYVATMDQAAKGKTIVLGNDGSLLSMLREVGLAFEQINRPLSSDDLNGTDLLILAGGDVLSDSQHAIDAYHKRGGKIYWHAPDGADWSTLTDALGLDSLRLDPTANTTIIRTRDNPILQGIAREDLTHTSESVGWRRTIAMSSSANASILPASSEVSTRTFLDQLEADELNIEDIPWNGRDNGMHIVRDSMLVIALGYATFQIDAPEAGLYPVSFQCGSPESGGAAPQVQVHVDGRLNCLIHPDAQRGLLELNKGINHISLVAERNRPTGPFGRLLIDKITVGKRLKYPDNVEVLTLPASIVRVDDSLVIDTVMLETDGPNAAKSRRYLSALLANLGASFEAPVAGPNTADIPLADFGLIGESPYYEARPSSLIIRSNGLVRAPFEVVRGGAYGLALRGSSTPYNGEYCKVRLLIDGEPIGELEINDEQTGDFGPLQTVLQPGNHTIGLQFFNDGSGNGEDRNLQLEAVRFVEP